MNVFDWGLIHQLHRKGLENPEFLGGLWKIMDKLQDPHYGGPLRAALNTGYFLPHEAFGFVGAWGAIYRGEIAQAILRLDDECGYDRSVDHNNNVLQNCRFVYNDGGKVKILRHSAEFVGGAGDNDGHFTTHSPLVATRHRHDEEPCHIQTVLLEPRMYPLEVGSCSVGTVVAHMIGEFGLARWPYGDKNLYLFHKIGDDEKVTVIGSRVCDSSDELPHKPGACAGASP